MNIDSQVSYSVISFLNSRKSIIENKYGHAYMFSNMLDYKNSTFDLHVNYSCLIDLICDSFSLIESSSLE